MKPRSRPAGRTKAGSAGKVGTTKARWAETWRDTRQALGSAQARIEKEARSLAARAGIDPRQAAEALLLWRKRLARQRREALKQLEGRMRSLRTRAKRERQVVARLVDEAVRSALAALNIPSRREVQELTRRVEELSRQIDGLQRRPRRSKRARARG